MSIFVTKSGDWKLGDPLLCHGVVDGLDFYKQHYKVMPEKYRAPEVSAGGDTGNPSHALDAWQFGCLIHEVYNGPLQDAQSLKQPNRIPKILLPQYKELLAGNPRYNLA